MNESLKVQPRHLERGAYLYIRQSSMRQVIENVESTKRQYALRGRAAALDSDQGESGASASWRGGFQRLVTDVGMGHAGIVMGLECQLDRSGRHLLGDQSANRFVDGHACDRLATRFTEAAEGAVADVPCLQSSASRSISDAEMSAASPTHRAPLQQGRPLSRW